MLRDYAAAHGFDEDRLRAAEHIDALTFYRIESFEELSAVQQLLVTKALDELTEFERSNSDLLESGLKSYSVNGVSMTLSDGLRVVQGVTVPQSVYSALVSTGLCYPGI